MKKIISIMLCLSLGLCLCACTDSKDDEQSSSGKIEITEDGTLIKDGIEGVELPDVVVKPKDENQNSNPDSSVSSDGSSSSSNSNFFALFFLTFFFCCQKCFVLFVDGRGIKNGGNGKGDDNR